MTDPHRLMKRSAPSPTAIAVVLFGLAVSLHLPGLRDEARAEKYQKIVGTWEVTVAFVDCTTGAPTAFFSTLQTFFPSGSFIDQGNRPGTPPTADRTVGQGVWERDGGVYKARMKFFRFDSNGAFIGHHEITRTIAVNARGDYLAGAAVGRGFDAAGNTIGVGCLSEEGRRLTVD